MLTKILVVNSVHFFEMSPTESNFHAAAYNQNRLGKSTRVLSFSSGANGNIYEISVIVLWDGNAYFARVCRRWVWCIYANALATKKQKRGGFIIASNCSFKGYDTMWFAEVSMRSVRALRQDTRIEGSQHFKPLQLVNKPKYQNQNLKSTLNRELSDQ